MKFALLGLALTATASQAQYKDQGYGRPGYQEESSYGYQPSYEEGPSGYGRPSQPSGYGRPPAKQPGYGKPPAPTGDQTKRHFDQYYDNLKFCAAETSLAQCIISSQSREDCVSEDRINICTNQFISNLCSSIKSTTTGTYDNGYFKATSNTCVDAALANSMLVYNKILRETDNAFVATPQIDEWSFATIKLALSTTRTHADCVIKSFFNYLNGCAKARVLRTKDLECVRDALSEGRCKYAYETGDGWNLRGFLESYKAILDDFVTKNIEKDTIIPGLPSLEEVTKLLQDSTFSEVAYVEADYDFKEQKASLKLKKPTSSPTPIDPTEGTNIENLVFHLPLESEKKTLWKPATTTPPTVGSNSPKENTIYQQCGQLLSDSKQKWTTESLDQWVKVELGEPSKVIRVRVNDKNNFECITESSTATACKRFGVNDLVDTEYKLECPREAKSEGADCKEIRTKMATYLISDRCYSYNGYSITFLDKGVTNPLEITSLSADYVAKWSEPHTCNSHLTQWKQSVSCCKSYATILREAQTSWDKQYKIADTYGKKVPARPTEIDVQKYDLKKAHFEKVFTSSKDVGQIKLSDSRDPVLALSNLSDEFKELIAKRIAKITKKKNTNTVLLAAEYEPYTPSCYLSSSKTYSSLCTSLQRSWDPNTVIPIASTKCFPQACVLSQLSKCADIPEKKAGYDYVAQPQPGYNGYRPSYVQKSYLALESAPTGILAIAGFAAGAAVVVVAQLALKARESQSSKFATSYSLV